MLSWIFHECGAIFYISELFICVLLIRNHMCPCMSQIRFTLRSIFLQNTKASLQPGPPGGGGGRGTVPRAPT
jgi:hypothetical protein